MIMETLSPSQESDLLVRKMTGRGYLSANRFSDALELYAAVLRDYPQDLESYIVLGDLYLAGDDVKTAENLYAAALDLDPANGEIQNRLSLARAEIIATPAEPVPTDPQAITRLLQRLTGDPLPIGDAEIEKAAEMLAQIIQSDDPAGEVAKNLNKIDALLPALIELNIRQARSDGRPDLAEVLGELNRNIELQKVSSVSAQSRDPAYTIAHPRFQGKVTLVVPDPQHLTDRMALLKEGLANLGSDVCVVDETTDHQGETPQVVIASNPHLNPRMLESLARWSAARIPIIVDLDTDFEHMPVTHPDYARLGLGTSNQARAYHTALLLAERITVSNPTMAESLTLAGYPARVVLDGWTRFNSLWEKPAPTRATLNLGWVGEPGQVDDVLPVRRIIIRVMHEFPETQLVIVGNSDVYHLFDSVPQNRRMFFPLISNDDFPYLLSHIDVLIAPYQNTLFNRTLSDRLLMQSGVRSIPWIASPVPAFIDWGKGGVIATTLDEWHTYLRQFNLDEDLRKTMGKTGNIQAQTREAAALSMKWLDQIEELLANSANHQA
jgi:tetratricopeptide (TPR) repeat protein